MFKKQFLFLCGHRNCLFNCIAAPNALREIDKEIQREYEVIHKVHMHLDDDHSGMVDKKETAEVSSLTRVLYLE